MSARFGWECTVKITLITMKETETSCREEPLDFFPVIINSMELSSS
jgi:hypothetical protein